MSLRATFLHDPYLVGNGAWCSTCCPDGPPIDLSRVRFRHGCNECGGHGRVAFSAETIVRMTPPAASTPIRPSSPTSPAPARRLERVRPVLRRRPA